MISVAIIRPDEALRLPWDHLRPFAHNAFMNPVALKAAADTMLAAIYILVAWEVAVEPARLVGYWALQARHLALWPYLESLPFNYAFLSTPILNPDHADDIMPAFLAAIAGDRRLPKTILIPELDAAGREYSALEPLLATHPQAALRQMERPIATREVGLKRSGSTRKKLRQDWNRLGGEGTVEIENARDASGVAAAFETFLMLEAASWKGREGTAMLSNDTHASFARRLVADLARQGNASVAVLRLDDRPIATQVLLYCGQTAYTWKTSFDPAYARFSPGVLLVDRIVMDLLDSGQADLVDSCSRSDGFMGQLLNGRKPMVDLVMSATTGPSPGFFAVSSYFKGRAALKAWRDRSRRSGGPSRPEAGAAPLTRPAPSLPAAPEAASPASRADRAA